MIMKLKKIHAHTTEINRHPDESRAANRHNLDAEGISIADVPTLKQVARKVAWLEQEIRDLRRNV